MPLTTITVHTKDFGELFFQCPDAGGYVTVRKYGENPLQPCIGGGFLGVTLIASPANLRRIAHQWLRQRRKANREA